MSTLRDFADPGDGVEGFSDGLLEGKRPSSYQAASARSLQSSCRAGPDHCASGARSRGSSATPIEARRLCAAPARRKACSEWPVRGGQFREDRESAYRPQPVPNLEIQAQALRQHGAALNWVFLFEDELGKRKSRACSPNRVDRAAGPDERRFEKGPGSRSVTKSVLCSAVVCQSHDNRSWPQLDLPV